MVKENSRGRVSLAWSQPPHRATSCSSISKRPTRPWPLPFSVAFRLSLFSSSIAYRAIGGEDSLLVSPPRSLRFSRASSRGTDWTIHHCCFSLLLLFDFFVFLYFSFLFSPISIAKESDIGTLCACMRILTHTYIYTYTYVYTNIVYICNVYIVCI